MDFGLIKTAGLTQDEFAALCGGVTRSTVSLWVTGRWNPHRLLGNTVQVVLDDLKAAVEAGTLPLGDDVARDDRPEAIKRALATVRTPA